MGQVGDKCNCFKDKSEQTTYTFEDQRDNQPSYKSNFDANDFLNKKAKSGIYESKNFELKYPSLKDPNKLRKLVKLQTLVKGVLYRKEYERIIKKKLMQETYNLLDKYTQDFRTPTLYKAESYKNASFDPYGWKKFYSPDEKLFNFDFGKVLSTKILIYNDGLSIYSGQINLKNQKHGYGVLLTKEGMKYEGTWVNNKFTGWGRFIDTEGNIYNGKQRLLNNIIKIGRFDNGKLNGFGEKTSLVGSHYVGEFKNNLKEGFGVDENIEHIYEGEFKDDKKDGKGKLAYKTNSDVYVGEFKNNSITGNGFYTWTNKDTYQGTFINGKMHGKGLYKWPDGGEYYGEYLNNIKHGVGKFKWANGKIYEGPFKNGKPHGVGKMFINDYPYEVEFQEGKLFYNKEKGSSLKSTSEYSKPKK